MSSISIASPWLGTGCPIDAARAIISVRHHDPLFVIVEVLRHYVLYLAHC